MIKKLQKKGGKREGDQESGTYMGGGRWQGRGGREKSKRRRAEELCRLQLP